MGVSERRGWATARAKEEIPARPSYDGAAFRDSIRVAAASRPIDLAGNLSTHIDDRDDLQRSDRVDLAADGHRFHQRSRRRGGRLARSVFDRTRVANDAHSG